MQAMEERLVNQTVAVKCKLMVTQKDQNYKAGLDP